MATIRPYRPKASAKMRIRIIPTKICSCWALALTPASPTIPIARPAAYGKVSKKKSYERGETAAKTRGEMLVATFVRVGVHRN